MIAALEEAQSATVEQTIQRVRAEIPSYESVPDAELRESVTKNIERCLHAIRTGEIPEKVGLDNVTKRITAQRSVRAVPIEDMVRAYRMCQRPVYELLIQRGTELGISSSWLLDRSWLLWRLGDWFMTSVELDYRYSLASDLFHEAMEREALATLLLEGGARDADLLHRLRMAGYPQDGMLDIYVTDRDTADPGDQRTAFGMASTSRGAIPLETSWQALQVHICASGSGAPDGPWAVTRDVPYDDVPRAATLAARVWNVRGAAPSASILTVDDVGWRVAVPDDPDLGAILHRRYLEPADIGTPTGRDLVATLRAYLDQGCNVRETARAMTVHQNTVRYRLDQYRRLTGLDIAQTHHLINLAWALEVDRHLTETQPPDVGR